MPNGCGCVSCIDSFQSVIITENTFSPSKSSSKVIIKLKNAAHLTLKLVSGYASAAKTQQV